jgi:hypothetical protein
VLLSGNAGEGPPRREIPATERGGAASLEKDAVSKEGCTRWIAWTERESRVNRGSRYSQLHARRSKTRIDTERFGGGAAAFGSAPLILD